MEMLQIRNKKSRNEGHPQRGQKHGIELMCMKTLLEGKKEVGKELRDTKSKNGRRWIRGEPEAENIY